MSWLLCLRDDAHDTDPLCDCRGFAWAATRTFLNKTGGLFDMGIAGAGDHHMALACVGKVEHSIPNNIGGEYLNALLRWQERAVGASQMSLGYVKGTILHEWHGAKRNRQYQSRWKILTDAKFDPLRDITKNAQGIWELAGTNNLLRDSLSNYMASRDEDSTTL